MQIYRVYFNGSYSLSAYSKDCILQALPLDDFMFSTYYLSKRYFLCKRSVPEVRQENPYLIHILKKTE